MKILNTLRNWSSSRNRGRRLRRPQIAVEAMEQRMLLSGDSLPVLMVVADQQDFYYQEYGDTRDSLEAAGLDVVVAAATTETSKPETGTSGGPVPPELALADVNGDDYSAIVFVGGWGSSMYQYDYPGPYSHERDDHESSTYLVVNDLINEFVDQEKYVAAICHGVSVLAWARVDGESPLSGKQVSVPYTEPASVVDNGDADRTEVPLAEQVVENGGRPNMYSGQYGDPTTATDDVVVDGRIITAENYDSAAAFGMTIAGKVIAAGDATQSTAPMLRQNPVGADAAEGLLWAGHGDSLFGDSEKLFELFC